MKFKKTIQVAIKRKNQMNQNRIVFSKESVAAISMHVKSPIDALRAQLKYAK
jgi:hypothetical protein